MASGVTVSPYILSLVINSDAGWRGGYRIAFGIQLRIALILFLTLSVWKKAHGQDTGEAERTVKTLPFREIARIPGVKLMWCLFVTSCAIECTCGGWGSTYLVEYKHKIHICYTKQWATCSLLYSQNFAMPPFLVSGSGKHFPM